MSRRFCLIPQPIHESGVRQLRENGIEPLVGEAACESAPIEDVVAAIYRSGQFSRTRMVQLPNLRAIAVHGVGIDGIDLPGANELGIAVFNTPGANNRSVAEHAIALMFALTKRIPESDRAVREGNFSFRFEGGLRELLGARLGVIGFGAIGQLTAKLALGMGMQVQILSRRSEEELAALGLQKAHSLESLLATSDVVSLHAPSLPETQHMIGAEQLKTMKPSAFLINTSRGALVDEAALITALQTGQIAGAGLDVFAVEPLPASSPLTQLSNVILTPHAAASAEQALMRMASAAVSGVLDILDDRAPASLINPQIWETRRR
ncbi:hydroxyacid dehydrogenase [Rouxiella badensis]|jgi:D-3-phosphoglycerate dehydrogenase|uniref:Hydroxyacid dehydrogenase n=1 Tax=Rouxiella badensis TaxID=1646377 RepID=A0A1X0WHE4_9GAMM|nr:hydroxyacid dehydrogenase [Rouxiella badensis]MCC3721427.1 hydroxyacid dehydrogenase [Rouxiella badensis]MCC3730992.1 hydroxyacid dehydrogenase [Rouxiella badensis]MCC3735209.1 hydroxyacid dehydrogenase [Rouxiella badensis]MCC3742303.1 hydroxyacid dehydrogenase [Rouxiella badensis]MCC3760506.1 hydroxyacid dehydrogenase [Rouxiella badensis]